VPFITSGFWSKDDIIAGLLTASERRGGVASALYIVLFILALVTAGLTAFYTFRAYFLTFEGEEKVPHEAGHHAHESPPVMWVPLAILAVGAILIGFINAEPFTSGLSTFLERGTPQLERAVFPEISWGVRGPLWLGSLAFAAAGIGGAWWVYVRQPGLASRLSRDVPVAYQASLNKFYVDEVYDLFIVRPLAWFAGLCRGFDLQVVDQIVDLVAQVPRWLGILFGFAQNGLVQFYALAMLLGLTVFLLALGWSY
jgi:NADH-quinone oxidoreductase subunit L